VVVQFDVAAGAHLLHGLFVAPVLELHAVDGGKDAGAVDAGQAVHEHGVIPRVAHDLTELADSLLRRRLAAEFLPAVRRDADEVDLFAVAEGFLGPIGSGAAVAQADHGTDGVIIQDALQGGFRHPAAAVEHAIANHTEVPPVGHLALGEDDRADHERQHDDGAGTDLPGAGHA
jgi:hypothetical protein